MIATILLRASLSVSSVPNEPTSGFATVQSPVSFGHPGPAASPAALNASRSRLAVPSRISSPGAASTFAADGPVRNCRSFTCAGQPGAELAGVRLPAGEEVLAALVLGDHDVERAQEAGRRRQERTVGPSPAKTGCPKAGIAGVSASAGWPRSRSQRDVLAVLLAVAGLPGRVDEIGGPGGGDRPDLRRRAPPFGHSPARSPARR